MRIRYVPAVFAAPNEWAIPDNRMPAEGNWRVLQVEVDREGGAVHNIGVWFVTDDEPNLRPAAPSDVAQLPTPDAVQAEHQRREAIRAEGTWE